MNNKLLLLLSFLSMLSFESSAQSLVNTEKISFLNDKNYLASTELTYNGSFGNLDVQEFSGNIILGYKLKEKHLLRIMGGYKFLSENKNEIDNAGFIQIRYNYIINSSLRTFHFYQTQYDRSLLLDKRELYGSGLRYSFFTKDSSKFKVNVGVGVMYEEERLDPKLIGIGESANNNLFRMANYISVKYTVNERLRFLNTLYYQPSISDFINFRLLNEFSTLFSINDNFSFEFSIVYRLNNKPPSTLEKTDLNIISGIVVNL